MLYKHWIDVIDVLWTSSSLTLIDSALTSKSHHLQCVPGQKALQIAYQNRMSSSAGETRLILKLRLSPPNYILIELTYNLVAIYEYPQLVIAWGQF